MLFKQNKAFIQDCKFRLINLWIISWLLWIVFIFIVGLDAVEIDEKAPRIILNQGPYYVTYIHHPTKIDLFSFSYHINGRDIDLTVESTKYEVLPVLTLQRAVLVKDRSWFSPKYYFAEFSYKEYFDHRKCPSTYRHLCVSKIEEKTSIVPIEKINYEIIQKFSAMFFIFYGIWFLGIMLSLYGKTISKID